MIPNTYMVPEEHRANPEDWVIHEVYKVDRRFKGGRKLVEKRIIHRQDMPPMGGARAAYNRRTNLMTGAMYWEPADTPAVCSPACETFWSA